MEEKRVSLGSSRIGWSMIQLWIGGVKV
ncbi:hypothetical protein C5167_030804 [Papaver somniferum]|nr:hypothetical protein C5167_030804 [Papaver somniferum]